MSAGVSSSCSRFCAPIRGCMMASGALTCLMPSAWPSSWASSWICSRTNDESRGSCGRWRVDGRRRELSHRARARRILARGTAVRDRRRVAAGVGARLGLLAHDPELPKVPSPQVQDGAVARAAPIERTPSNVAAASNGRAVRLTGCTCTGMLRGA